MSAIKKLTQKEKELVSIATSIASGCPPCTTQHIKLALEAGAADGEMLRAIYIALDVRDNATEIMAEVALGNLVIGYPIRAQTGPIEQPIDDLMSMGAALACNSVSGLEYHLARARAAGASTRQVQTTIGIARAIRKEAGEEADAFIRNLIGQTPVNKDEPQCSCSQISTLPG